VSKRKSSLLMVACALAMVAAACGSSKSSSSSSGSSDAAAIKKVGGTMEVAAVWSGEEQTKFQKVMDAFTAKSGTKVTFTSTGDDIATVLRTRLQGGSPPDVAVLPQPGLMRDLASQGALKPIEDAAGKQIDKDWSKDWRTLGTVNGQLFGLFYKGANKSTVWYNTKAFSAAGVDTPKSYDDLLKTAQTLKDSGVTPFSVGGGDGWTLTDLFENIYVRQAGPDKYDSLSVHSMPWTDPSVKTALTDMAKVLDPKFVNGSATGTTFEQSVNNVFKQPPAAAMVIEGDFVPGVASVPAKAVEDFNEFAFPSVNQSPSMVVGGGDAAVMMKDTPQARAFISFLATTEAAEIWAKQGGFSSPNKSLDVSVYPDEIQRDTASALAKAATFRFDMSDLAPADFGGTVGRGEWAILQDFAKNPSDVDGTATKLEAAAAASFKK